MSILVIRRRVSEVHTWRYNEVGTVSSPSRVIARAPAGRCNAPPSFDDLWRTNTQVWSYETAGPSIDNPTYQTLKCWSHTSSFPSTALHNDRIR